MGQKSLWRFILIAILILALSFVGFTCTASVTTGELTIPESQMTTKNAYSVVTGSAESTSQWNVVEVNVKFYDAEGNLIGEGSDFESLDLGEIWNFEARCLKAGIAETYEITTSGDLTNITSDMTVDTEYAYSVVTGLAKNNGDDDLDYVSVVIKFYDADGNLMGQYSDFTEDLDPGETWSFEVTCPEGVASSYTIIWED